MSKFYTKNFLRSWLFFTAILVSPGFTSCNKEPSFRRQIDPQFSQSSKSSQSQVDKTSEVIPQEAINLVEQARKRLEKGDFQEAVEATSDALNIYSDLGDAYLLRGIAYAGLDELERAIQNLKSAQKIYQRKNRKDRSDLAGKLLSELKSKLSIRDTVLKLKVSKIEYEFKRYTNLQGLPGWKKLPDKKKIEVARGICKTWRNGGLTAIDRVAVTLGGEVGISMPAINTRMDSSFLISASMAIYCPNQIGSFQRAAFRQGLR